MHPRMKSIAPAALAGLAVVLAALAGPAVAQGQGQGNGQGNGQEKDRPSIEVRLVDGKVNVPEETVRTTAEHVALVWHLTDAGVLFADNGIAIESGRRHLYQCQVNPNRRSVRCQKLGHARGETHKYDVNLIDANTRQPLPRLDPYIQND